MGSQANVSELQSVAEAAARQVRAWLAEPAQQWPTGARRLAELLREESGLDFAVQFVDGVARPRDLSVAARRLHELSGRVPASLHGGLRTALGLGGQVGPVLPWVVVPAARAALRRLVGHLVVDATPAKLGPALERLRQGGHRLNLNLLGEAVLGEEEAGSRLAGIRALLERPDVDYVSVKVSNVVSNVNLWGFDDAVARVAQRLTPLYELAGAGGETSVAPGRTKFINLDMEEYKDLDLTVAVFKRVLSNPRLAHLEAGIVLQAYLPDALDALQDLTEWAQARRAAGGAAIKVRLVKGANLPMERVDAELHGWPLATWGSKLGTDVNYKRVLDWALTSEHTDAVRIGVAGHNLFDVAFAWELAGVRGVRDRIDFEMLLGMATDAVARTVGGLTLYTPVVRPEEFDVAISYLVRRLEENGSPENFMSATFELSGHGPNTDELFERERGRFLDAVERYEAVREPVGVAPLPNRRQDRAREWQDENATALFHPRVDPVDPAGQAAGDAGLTSAVLGLPQQDAWVQASPAARKAAAFAPPLPAEWQARGDRQTFRNESDSDPSRAANRAWAKRILARVPGSDLGIAAVIAARVSDERRLDQLIAAVRAAGVRWAQAPGSERADVLDFAGLAIAANRDQLIEIMVAETGKTFAEADVEVTEAADFAHYYAALARELDTVQGARFEPSALTVVTPPWNFPVSIPAGGVLSALAAGSGVIVKPAPQAKRCAAVLVDVLHRAGIPRDALALVDVDEEAEVSRQLITDDRVDRVILTGSFETAQLFRSWRPDLPLLAETSGKNAIVVTPSADYDLAVADIVKSAFGNAGQKCSAASLVILVGSVADDARFRRQLVDAARSLRVGPATDAATELGPLVQPPTGKLAWALTELDDGETWLVRPRRVDTEGDDARLWSPGIKTGVAAGSRTHLTEFFGPVLGVMRARTLAEAIRLQNAVEYGLTAGLHSLDAREIAQWLRAVEAGNLYVNRHITGAIVQRQSFGGWKKSAVGPTVKAGGPNTLFPLGTWASVPGEQSHSLHLRGLDPDVQQLIELSQSELAYEDFDLVRRSALSDAIAYATEYGRVADAAGLTSERNLFRYRPVPASIRLGDDGRLPELLRVLAAASVSRTRYDVSTSASLPAGIATWLEAHSVPVKIEDDDAWLARLAFRPETIEVGGPAMHPKPIHRIRLIGGNGLAAARALRGDPEVAIYDAPVTASGRVELLPFFREQSISITNHRYGAVAHLTDDVI
ncbi:proline dehydrogenase family protein [Gryllotalpicola protaetiae]|uniref:L-glutamate gamma-semialdehyde dehydrogenase n=1 Tax=Gryllotalpicola protaetiae TaxID=2419771 RepID=A0A387BMR9_9MICO|nr:proline dehydrogenase family protein [Gryllotalpicola protaetiae]AYG03692.1 aldehyde dehydrogenase family protein [Gryllotalpicola protaetiae]